ncbi:hypothetical protein U8P73_09845 [Rhizobium beringeri]|uniref:hypothetical protein n=1 Tax=Rhizobium beringeri TaxID=3019934 RepID=UPI002DDCBBD5|nr:hypothetical protein [Rhizobium beringeri]WSG90730.1 hypothetical protein U8P73_09845 [Rhizobium beringeri]
MSPVIAPRTAAAALAIAAVALTMSTCVADGANAGELSLEQVKRFDTNGDDFVDSDKATVYARHIYDQHNILADYDKNLNGQIDPDELVAINSDLSKIDREPVSAEVRLRAAEHVPIPLMAGPASIEAEVSEDVARAYLREKRVDLGIDTEKPGSDITSGAAITMANDLEGHENIVSIEAAAGYLFRKNIPYPESYNPGDLALTAVSFGPYIEANGDVNSAESRVAAGAMAQAEVLGGGVFDLQRYSVAPYYQTDFRGRSSVYGAAFSWQPYILDWALGSIRSAGTLDVTWGLLFQGDYRFVADAGETGLKTDDDYAWLGAVLSTKIWPFPDTFESRVFAELEYSYFHDTLSGADASLFQGGVGLTLDEKGNATLNVEYTNGRDYKTETDKNTIKTALKVKF